VELHQLRYFVSVADLGTFTQAAKACFVAQPSLSQQIHKLESELGQELFVRLGRGARLTPAGRAFYDRAAAILSAVAEARDTLRDSSARGQGEVRLAAIPTVAPYLLPRLVRTFRRKFPQAQVSVHEDFTAGIIRGCVAGEFDVGVVAMPVDDPRVASEALFSEDMLVAFPPHHPLRKKRRIGLDLLTTERFVLLSEIHCLGEQIVRFCDRQGCVPAVTCRSAQLLTVQELVSLGQGISLVPEMAAKADREKKIVYRALAGVKPSRTLGIIWHRHRYISPLVNALIETIRQETRREKKGQRKIEVSAAD
jgi:LysR family hydrogen peroxide-inducible transcriptional activator